MRGHVRKRGGVWCFVIDLPRMGIGARRQRWFSGFATRKQAQTALSAALGEIGKGSYVEPSALTVGEFLQRWLDDYVQHNCAAKTGERYAEIVRNHVLPVIGAVKLRELKPAHIQELYSLAKRAGRRDGRGGLSSRTVHHIHRVLTNAFNTGVKWQLLATNPVKATTPPRPESKEMVALSQPQSLRLLALLEECALRLPVFLALTTGMRRGELLGLKWGDVDWDRGVVSIKRALKQSRRGLEVKKPKTARSARTIALPPIVIDELRSHKAVQAERRIRLGRAYNDMGLVLAGPDGAFIRPDALSSTFAAFIRRHPELPKARFHDLRHTHASLLLEAGEHAKVVSERLGHSSVAFTLDTYGHLMPGMEEGAAAKLNGLFGAAGRTKNN
jgi:integrase